ncbi:hypothetical protein DDB_G0288793 [Dictyostelium discoideum AX4]|uniref:FNIP repeat-containing protein n=1 Tax=Dictyostelium discoideum TaxID=44689 RepID=Q54IF3_DICDI|nr:hypothetical protein DDB_G0288793 [Dictyostelium discoideum AX4]EAL63018.1 hypothetical protein DDB_G0288793 [Dictyostelium discoideum AX4]|eukprot:XP_636524.1 hypothetical protein DDB_G0288793 [Dictyostelium discoideum AX4]
MSDDSHIEKLFFKVFRNCFLRKIIFSHVSIFQKNREIRFESLKELRDFKFRDYIESLRLNCNEILKKGDIPESGFLKKIIFSSLLNVPKNFQTQHYYLYDDGSSTRTISKTTIDYSIIPQSVQHMEIRFPISLYPDDINISKIPTFFNSIVNIGITERDVNALYGHLLRFPSLIKISIRCGYNIQLTPQLFQKFSTTLTSLDLGREWQNNDTPIQLGDLDYLVNLKTLKISSYGRELFENVLPPKLEKLTICEYLSDVEICNKTMWVLPKTIKNLTITDSRFPPLLTFGRNMKLYKGLLPNGITHLQLLAKKMTILPFAIPDTVEYLLIDKILTHYPILSNYQLPKSLKKLDIVPSTSKFIIEQNALSDLNQLLSFSVLSFYDTDFVPSCWNHKIDIGFFPQSITSIDFGQHFNQPLTKDHIGLFPNSLKELTFGFYNHPIPIGLLPNQLKTLNFINGFNQIIEIGSLPSSLTFLNLSLSYKKSILPNALPSSIIHLKPKNLNKYK